MRPLFWFYKGLVVVVRKGVHDQRVEIYNLWSIKEIVIVSLKNGEFKRFFKKYKRTFYLTFKKSP